MKTKTARKASKKRIISGRKTARTKPRKKRAMSDKPKPWPYQAAEARDRSAEEAQIIVNQATDALDMTNDPSLLKKIGKMLASATTILRHMESQGAKTRPR